MSKLIYLFILTLSFSFAFFGFNRSAEAQNKLPPIIDREIIFGNPEIEGARISPDGKFIAFRKPYKGTMNVWIKSVDEGFDNSRLLTNETDRPISEFFWSRDGKFVLFEKDKGGDENYNIYAVAAEAPPVDGAVIPVARNLTNAEHVRTRIVRLPPSEPDGTDRRERAINPHRII